jgi:RNA polymerase sigma factor (sigma-70 family)
MAKDQIGNGLRSIRRLFGGADGATTDAQLLDRFVGHGDEQAFTALVERHGPLVFSVCRRVLSDAHLAEDAFQATFLVLARKAAGVHRPNALANWLYGVAYKTAARLRTDVARRRKLERQAKPMPQTDPLADATWRELRPVLDEELNRLPEKYRAPLILCYLEGKTHEEAAQHLHWPMGTVGGRLARARDVLRQRLERRGLALSAGAVALTLTENAGGAAVPNNLITSTVQTALPFAAGPVAASAAGPAVGLAEGVLKAMFLSRLTFAATVLLTVGLIGSGIGLWAARTHSAEVRAADQLARKADETKPETNGKPGQANDEGEKLFRQMEAKVSKAKAFDLSFDITVEAGNKADKLKGTLTSKSGNKARLEMNGEFQGNPLKVLMVSDGTRMKTTDAPAKETPKKLDGMFQATVARSGVLFPYFFIAEVAKVGEKPKEFDPDEQMPISEFRLGKKEKLGERDAQVVEYKLTTKGAEEPFWVTVWIDAKTSVPLKRVLTAKQGMTITETYTRLVLDEKFDEKQFELPK